MARTTTPHEVLAKHQFPEGDGGGCSDRKCGWGLYAAASDGGPPPSENEQIAEHQIEMLAEAGFKIVRG